MHERSAVKNPFSTYVWSKVDSCFGRALYYCRVFVSRNLTWDWSNDNIFYWEYALFANSWDWFFMSFRNFLAVRYKPIGDMDSKDGVCLQLHGQASRQPMHCLSAMLDPKGQSFRCASGSLLIFCVTIYDSSYWLFSIVSSSITILL